MTGFVLGPFALASPARRVRVGGTRGVGVIHQVRIEPSGRAAVEHAYVDDNEDEAQVEAVGSPASDAQAPRHAAPAFPVPTAEIRFSAASSFTSSPFDSALPSADLYGIRAGRAPPRN